ncbi:hypothetical protein CVT24_010908 [Panaeolus cyanescens]|uniref:DUF7330 domain-containing protein n=1 Tax=Panaeolus cyanescens TaxID=181874 RepID=A0A409WAT4_9AGAR|nr:hypothetical protein CVT24_010908 [Panaeolus cyanescens]
MIIVDDKQVEALEARRLAEEQEQEPPPTYASLHHGGVVLEQAPPPPISVRSAAALTVSSSPTLNSNASSPSISSPDGANANGRNIKRVNHLAITRTHASIKESVLVDPSLFVPVFLRPPLLPGETEESRRNLRIEAVHGNVWADIRVVGVGFGEGDRMFRGLGGSSNSTVVGDADDEEDDDDGSETVIGAPVKRERKGKRVFMQLKSTHGGIQAKIHGPPNRHPVVLHASATHGDIKLYLPRSFHGPVIIAHKHGLVRFSDALAQELTTFGEVDGIRRCFLGDFSVWAKQVEKQKQRNKEKEKEDKAKDNPSSNAGSGSSSTPSSPVSPSFKDPATLFGFSKDKSNKVHKKRSMPTTSVAEWANNRSSGESNGRSMLEEVAEQSGLGAESGWTGDELLVEVRHANVKLQFCDDAAQTPVKSRPTTFLNRIFGF